MSGADDAIAIAPAIGEAAELKSLIAAPVFAVVPKGFAPEAARTRAKLGASR